MKRVLLTGATGCLGSYLLAELLAQTDCQITVWVRQPERLWPVWRQHPRVRLRVGDLCQASLQKDLFRHFDALIHPAVAWGGAQTFSLNVHATRRLFAALDPERCRQIHCFSTASLLDARHQIWPQAHTLGTDYIRSKAALAALLQQQPPAIPLTLYYPPLIVGGDGAAHPLTPLTAGLPQALRFAPLLQYLSVDGGLHFIHAADLAALVVRRLCTGIAPAALVPGQNWCSVMDLMAATARSAGAARANWKLPLQPALPALCYALQRQMSAWDRFSLHVRSTRYQVVRPEDYGLTSRYPRWTDILAAYT
ncbi:MAG: NAD(P)-dependent oxidoreductase [Candidatus Sericytochromatia bacterium]|nr:NAD(P)-dependent oxidoreductase [Candidatus Sericytochromatia bacterium]